MMNARLDYANDGRSYAQYFQNFKVKVTRSPNGKRISFSFKETKDNSYASYSLPVDKAEQFGHAILAACAGELLQPIEFQVDESKPVTA